LKEGIKKSKKKKDCLSKFEPKNDPTKTPGATFPLTTAKYLINYFFFFFG